MPTLIRAEFRGLAKLLVLMDVGPAGVDKGKGGKYSILPPEYKAKPPNGYIVIPSDTYAGYGLLRSILKSGSDADIAEAAAYGRRIKLYPLSQAANPVEPRRRARRKLKPRSIVNCSGKTFIRSWS